MISKKDSKPFLAKSVIANSTDASPKPIYDNWQVLSGLISDPNGLVVDNAYGSQQEYDRILILNATDLSRQIKDDTALLLDEYPTSVYPQGNYYIKRIFPEYNREIQIGLIKRDGIDVPELYFEKDGKLLTYQLNYDKDTLCGYVDSKRQVPFTSTTKIWTRRPSDLTKTNHRIVLKAVNSVGIDNSHKYFKELVFGAYNG